MADATNTPDVPSRLFRRQSMTLNPRGSFYERTGSVLTIRRDTDGEYTWDEARGIPAVRVSIDASASEQEGLQSPLLPSSVQGDRAGSVSGSEDSFDARVRFAMNISLVANVLLLLAKAYAFYVSMSRAVLASAADSFVDIASQVGSDALCPNSSAWLPGLTPQAK